MSTIIIGLSNNNIQSARRRHVFLLTQQEVHVNFVAMIALRIVLAREHSTYTCLIYHVCDYIIFSIYSTVACLYGAPLMYAYRADRQMSAGQVKVMEVSTHYCINQDSRKLTLVHYKFKLRHL